MRPLASAPFHSVRKHARTAFGLMGKVIATTLAVASLHAEGPDVIIIRGADGTPEYGKRFDVQVNAWKSACDKSGAHAEVITKLEDLKASLQHYSEKPGGTLWLALVGHGTYDGRDARFNLNGPDFTAAEFAEWLRPVERELVIIDTASSSGAFVKPLAGARRIIVTSTRSGDEVFYPRFGEHFALAIAGDLKADLDQDQQVSVLEAFVHASRKASEFYETEGRIATEHALIEDNGDGTGTRADRFEGVRAKDPKSDGARASQTALVLNEYEARLSPEIRAQRDALEMKVRDLAARKETMNEDAYYKELESLFVRIARLTADSGKQQAR